MKGDRTMVGQSALAPPTQDPFDVRRYRPGDEGQIIDLFERTFGRSMGPTESSRHWEWEFRGNPSGKLAILLAESGGRLAAQYAVLPLAVQIDGRAREAALSLDTATDASFRGRGLFPRLARQLYSELGDQGYAAVFGFPNEQSAPSFFKKLDWVELAPFPLLLKPLRGAVSRLMRSRGAPGRAVAPLAEGVAALWRRGPRAIPRGLGVEEVRAFPSETDQLWERAGRGKRISVVRDQHYLNWRYVARPESTYRIHLVRETGRLVGTLVTLVEDRHSLRSGFLMDMVCEESRADVAAALVSLAERVMARDGPQVLSALMYPGTIAYRELRAAGFFPVPRRLFPQQIYFGVRALSAGIDEHVLHERSNWYITWGDADLV